jgi:hypothetical protein
MLMLAGICHFATMSQGPIRPGDALGSPEGPPLEHREASKDTFLRELHLAIGVYSDLAQLVEDGSFDGRHEPRVEAIAYDRDGNPCIWVRRGVKLG